MLLNKKTNGNYTPRQLKLPLEIEKIIDISDPVYTFCDVMDHIDLSKYFVESKGYKTGRPRCDSEKLLKVIDNFESIHGALLRMNRSIQAEGTFGIIKWDRTYKRLFRRGEKSVIMEFTLISCGFNLYKYHNKLNRQIRSA